MLYDIYACLKTIVNFILFLWEEISAFFVGLVKVIALSNDLVAYLPAFLVPFGGLFLSVIIANKVVSLK